VFANKVHRAVSWIHLELYSSVFQGADVNSGKHEYGYTALHFAALSGNAELCHLLLMAGAKSQTTNSVGRTASQMAAFVGKGATLHRKHA
jgi:ankyrin repeat protein